MDTEKPIDQSIQKEVEKKQKPVFYFEEPEYLEKNPIISRETITIGDHEIEFINQNPNVQLDQEHLRQAQEVLERIYAIAPELVKNYEKVFIIYKPGLEDKIKDDPYSYAPNAENIQSQERMKDHSYINDGIVINQLGFSTNLPHRIKEVNNFKGTLSHEIFHGIEWTDKYKYKKNENKGILYNFGEELGYHFIFQIGEWDEKERCHPPTPGWKIAKDSKGNFKGYIHEKTGYFTQIGYVPEELELVLTKYGQLKIEDDFCDSGVAYLFAPETLDPKRKKFFEKHFPVQSSDDFKK